MADWQPAHAFKSSRRWFFVVQSLLKKKPAKKICLLEYLPINLKEFFGDKIISPLKITDNSEITCFFFNYTSCFNLFQAWHFSYKHTKLMIKSIINRYVFKFMYILVKNSFNKIIVLVQIFLWMHIMYVFYYNMHVRVV